MTCEDAPCCGCCGTNIYGVYQGPIDEPPEYCDLCGYNHRGDCPDDDYDEFFDLEEDYEMDDEEEETMTKDEMLEGLGSAFRMGNANGPFD